MVPVNQDAPPYVVISNPWRLQNKGDAMERFMTLMGMMNDSAPRGRTPRADAERHIRGVLAANGYDPDRGDTVAHGVLGNISNLRAVFGERGARNVAEEVFMRPELTQYYLRPSSDREAHGVVTDVEMRYWGRENRTNPSEGTRAAVMFDRDTRIALQQGQATFNREGHLLLDQYRAEMNPSAHAQASMHMARASQHRQSHQPSSSPAGTTYPGQSSGSHRSHGGRGQKRR